MSCRAKRHIQLLCSHYIISNERFAIQATAVKNKELRKESLVEGKIKPVLLKTY